MKVNCVIEDDILAYSHFAVRSIRMYLYDFECGFECACTLVFNKDCFICTRETDFPFSIFNCTEDPASGPERM
jgi:hypothetical protein